MQVIMESQAPTEQVNRVINHLNALSIPFSITEEGGVVTFHVKNGSSELFLSLKKMGGIKKIVRGNKPLENANVAEIIRLDSPRALKERLPVHSAVRKTVLRGRGAVESILDGTDQRRFLVIVGPCSIHDTIAALDYASRLKKLADTVQDKMVLMMRVYFEKPRTTTGWQGFLRDPHLDGSFDAPYGLTTARDLLLQILKMGLLPATEFVDLNTPQYIDDLIVWGAVGARSAEAQAYRNLASGLGMPVGFKNGTGGGIQLAVNGVVAAREPNAFFGIDPDGHSSLIISTGNQACHIVLRGSSKGPNYEEAFVREAERLLREAGVIPRFLIDCSHDNTLDPRTGRKDYRLQFQVFREVLRQRTEGNACIAGVMLESNIYEGRQVLNGGPQTLRYGVSITDACIGWDETEELLLEAYSVLFGKALSGTRQA